MPFEDRKINIWGFFNEVAVSIYLYLMIVVNHLNMKEEYGIDLRLKIGWALLILVILTVLANLIKAIIVDIRSIHSWIKQKI